MEHEFNTFLINTKNRTLKMTHPHLSNVIYSFSFLFVFKIDDFQSINNSAIQSEIIILDKCKVLTTEYLIICFNKQIIIISKKDFIFINLFFNKNKKATVYTLTEDENEIFKANIHNKIAKDEIDSFKKNFVLLNKDLNSFFQMILPSISAYLIKKSFLNSRIDRVINYEYYFDSNKKELSLTKDDIIVLNDLSTSKSSVKLVYHIESEKLYILKNVLNKDENSRMFYREYDNYMNVNHPFLLKCFGKTNFEDKDFLILEFIEGQELNKIDLKNFKIEDKLKIIFEIMIIIEYLHNKGYIYRDLKPDNIILDSNNIAILIDLDLMIKKSNEGITEIFTDFVSPEIANNNPFSFPTDIYSIGKIINFMFRNEFEQNERQDNIEVLFNICHNCIEIEPSKRPTISQLIDDFYTKIYSNIDGQISEIDTIQFENIHSNKFSKYWFYLAENNNYISQYELGTIYFEGNILQRNIKKAIKYFSLSSDKNYIIASYWLGEIYYKGEFINIDINKAIKYYTLGANQNYIHSIIKLGVIYYEGIYVPRDIKKAIYYLKLASDQNNSYVQLLLGQTYYEAKLVPRDINKAIYYFTLAANQNNSTAEYVLGEIYLKAQYIDRDINKAIHYLTLSANHGFAIAQVFLGFIYYEGKYVERNINKAIQLTSDAANQGNLNAQYNLGIIYYENKYIPRNIERSLYYLQLAANKGEKYSQYLLGCIYYEGRFISRDINKAIHYYYLSANQGVSNAQFNLASIYKNGICVKHDMAKVIQYLTLAANQNHIKASFDLGYIYYNGQYIDQDINKAIYYITIAANQNDLLSQMFLGNFYFSDKTYANINKSIYYLELASNQNSLHAQNLLGFIYQRGEKIQRDINKAIHYYALSASKNDPLALINLGFIYYDGVDINRDINKAIYYFTRAANLNYASAQYTLGFIYLYGRYVPKDINKAIYYFTKGADNNDKSCQCDLGFIYMNGLYGIKTDQKKAFHYFSLSAKQGFPKAQYFLGTFYYEGNYVKYDINKAIYYFMQASYNNDSWAQSSLGTIYKFGIGTKKDIKKAIYYYSLSANQNNECSLFNLGVLYKENDFIYDINKSIDYFIKSAKLNDIDSMFYLALLYHKGLEVNCDIQKAIYYYKEASSFNFQYAKNNISIIYKKGFGKIIPKCLGNSVEYLKEAIQQKNDKLSMYNLAHIYIYNNIFENFLDESISLLIKSIDAVKESFYLLCIALIKKFNLISLDIITSEIQKYEKNHLELSVKLFKTIKDNNLEKNIIYQQIIEKYENIDLLYDFDKGYVWSKDFFTQKEKSNKDQKSIELQNVNSTFYDGFGLFL